MLKNITILLLGRGVMMARQFIVIPVMIRCWGLETFGEWMLLSALPTFASLSGLGVGIASGIEVNKAMARGDIFTAERELRRGLLLVAGFGLLIIAIGTSAASISTEQIELKHLSNVSSVALLLILVVALQQYQPLLQGVWNGLERSSGGFIWANIFHLGILIVSLCVPLADGNALQLALLSALWALGWLAAFSLSTWLLVRNHKVSSNYTNTSTSTIAPRLSNYQMIATGLGHQLSALWQAIYYQGPLLILGSIGGGAIVGAWTAFRSFARITNQAIDIVGQAVAPDFVALHGRNDQNTILDLISSRLVFSIIIAILGAVSLIIVGIPAFKYWVDGKVEISYSVWILTAFSYVPYALWMMLSEAVRSANKPWFINVGATGVSIVALLVMKSILFVEAELVAIGIGVLLFDVLMVALLIFALGQAINKSVHDILIRVFTRPIGWINRKS